MKLAFLEYQFDLEMSILFAVTAFDVSSVALRNYRTQSLDDLLGSEKRA